MLAGLTCGWSASECAVVIFEAQTGDMLDVAVVARKIPADTLGNFEGSSSCMEAAGVRTICNKLFEEGHEVVAVVHDRDGSTLNVVKEHWPEAVEYNDKGHGANNFRKAVIKLSKEFPALKNMGDVGFFLMCCHSFIHACFLNSCSIVLVFCRCV